MIRPLFVTVAAEAEIVEPRTESRLPLLIVKTEGMVTVEPAPIPCVAREPLPTVSVPLTRKFWLGEAPNLIEESPMVILVAFAFEEPRFERIRYPAEKSIRSKLL